MSTVNRNSSGPPNGNSALAHVEPYAVRGVKPPRIAPNEFEIHEGWNEIVRKEKKKMIAYVTIVIFHDTLLLLQFG